MWFKKKKKPGAPPPYIGTSRALEGLETAAAVSALGADHVLLEPNLGLDDRGKSISAEQIPGRIAGLAATGLRAAAVVSGSQTIINAASALTGKHLSCVFHLAPRARSRQANAIQGSHDACYAMADLGPFQLHASSVQEVADLSLVAHRAAELSLTPGICVQDLYATGLSVQQLSFPGEDLVSSYLGRAGDQIVTPTAAQQVLFGDRRRRIPRLMDLDRPLGLGGYQDQDSFPLAVAAQQPFFSDHVGTAIEQAMSEFEKLTGRGYGSIASHQLEDAEWVVLCMGAVDQALAVVVDELRAREGIKVGLVALTVLRPFPGAQLSQLLKGKRMVSVLERSDSPLSEDPPLMRELRAAIDKATENGATDGVLPYPLHASYRKPVDRPQLCSGTYGIGCNLPPAELLAAVFRNMQSKSPVRRFFLGVYFNQNERRFPQLQVLQQELTQAYPGSRNYHFRRPNWSEEITRGGWQDSIVPLASAASKPATSSPELCPRLPTARSAAKPKFGTNAALENGCLTLAYGLEFCRSVPDQADTVLVSGEALLDSVTSQAIAAGGRLIIATAFGPETVWRGLSRRVSDWIREHKLQVFVLAAREISGIEDSGQTDAPPIVVGSVVSVEFVGRRDSSRRPGFGSGL